MRGMRLALLALVLAACGELGEAWDPRGAAAEGDATH